MLPTTINGLDAAFAVAALAAVVIGYRRGSTRLIAKVVGYGLSFILAGSFSGPAVDWLEKQSGMVTRFGSNIGSWLHLPPEFDSIPVGAFSPDLITNVGDQLPLPAPMLEQLSRQMEALAAKGVGGTIGDTLSGMVAHSLLQASAFVVIMLIVSFVVGLLARLLTRGLDQVPVVAKVNRLLGAALSLVVVIIGIALLIGLAAPVVSLTPGGVAAQTLRTSQVALWLQPLYTAVLGPLLNGSRLFGGGS